MINIHTGKNAWKTIGTTDIWTTADGTTYSIGTTGAQYWVSVVPAIGDRRKSGPYPTRSLALCEATRQIQQAG